MANRGDPDGKEKTLLPPPPLPLHRLSTAPGQTPRPAELAAAMASIKKSYYPKLPTAPVHPVPSLPVSAPHQTKSPSPPPPHSRSMISLRHHKKRRPPPALKEQAAKVIQAKRALDGMRDENFKAYVASKDGGAPGTKNLKLKNKSTKALTQQLKAPETREEKMKNFAKDKRIREQQTKRFKERLEVMLLSKDPVEVERALEIEPSLKTMLANITEEERKNREHFTQHFPPLPRPSRRARPPKMWTTRLWAKREFHLYDVRGKQISTSMMESDFKLGWRVLCHKAKRVTVTPKPWMDTTRSKFLKDKKKKDLGASDGPQSQFPMINTAALYEVAKLYMPDLEEETFMSHCAGEETLTMEWLHKLLSEQLVIHDFDMHEEALKLYMTDPGNQFRADYDAMSAAVKRLAPSRNSKTANDPDYTVYDLEPDDWHLILKLMDYDLNNIIDVEDFRLFGRDLRLDVNDASMVALFAHDDATHAAIRDGLEAGERRSPWSASSAHAYKI
eukprot:gnl/Spiro4/21951_TR10777_c1_g1_i1.p1 gnl/Spiro4/21951_TR10777_c1_g1~~gnl/Spiro4/21951_TR10777_c1_g1_i1.p1  ORF type:complete len:503 (-),score=131.22 gnl/Spiro4/21951_TR10777_c1_g1_i1:27-1535(-)